MRYLGIKIPLLGMRERNTMKIKIRRI
jgi:hypothetical protein